MMNRASLQELSRIRINEAIALLRMDHYPGAYYLAGYAVECALKACIAKRVKRHDFPDRDLANAVFTHDLQTLLRLAELAPDFDRVKRMNAALDENWAVVKDWKETSRYELRITGTEARDFINACTARGTGILTWIRRRW